MLQQPQARRRHASTRPLVRRVLLFMVATTIVCIGLPLPAVTAAAAVGDRSSSSSNNSLPILTVLDRVKEDNRSPRGARKLAPKKGSTYYSSSSDYYASSAYYSKASKKKSSSDYYASSAYYSKASKKKSSSSDYYASSAYYSSKASKKESKKSKTGYYDDAYAVATVKDEDEELLLPVLQDSEEEDGEEDVSMDVSSAVDKESIVAIAEFTNIVLLLLASSFSLWALEYF